MKGKIEIFVVVELDVIIRNNIPYIRRRDLKNDETEMMWMEIKLKNQLPFFVGVVYRSPDCALSFFNRLESSLEQVFSVTDNVIVLVDVNSNMLTKIPYQIRSQNCVLRSS